MVTLGGGDGSYERGTPVPPSSASLVLNDYFKVDKLGVWHSAVNFGAEKNVIALNRQDRISL